MTDIWSLRGSEEHTQKRVVRHKHLRLHLSVAPPRRLSWIHNTVSLSVSWCCVAAFLPYIHPSVSTSPFIFVLASFISPPVLSLSTPHLLAVCACVRACVRESASRRVCLTFHWHPTQPYLIPCVCWEVISHSVFSLKSNQPAVVITLRTNTHREVQR